MAQKIIDHNAIMNQFGIGERRARRIKQRLEQELIKAE
jgi:hypothetical protein